MTRRLLVTGGAGFIGSNFVHYWLKAAIRKTGSFNLDVLTYAGNRGEPERGRAGRPRTTISVRARRHLRQGVGRTGYARRTSRSTLMVHFAAESHVDRSISGPEVVHPDVNVTGHLQSLLEAARQESWLDSARTAWAAPLSACLHRRSLRVARPADEPAFTETHPLRTRTRPYSASKASSDHLVRSYFGIPTNCRW